MGRPGCFQLFMTGSHSALQTLSEVLTLTAILGAISVHFMFDNTPTLAEMCWKVQILFVCLLFVVVVVVRLLLLGGCCFDVVALCSIFGYFVVVCLYVDFVCLFSSGDEGGASRNDLLQHGHYCVL